MSAPQGTAHPLDRPQSLREELCNAASHGIGFLLAAASLPVVLNLGQPAGSRHHVIGACVFSVTMTLVYFASMVYHALPCGRIKGWFHRLDHAAIFLFIAGSYTPFALQGLQRGEGFAAFALVWALALAGVVVKAGGRLKHPVISTLLYMALGWVALVAALPVVQRLAQDGLWLLVAGGAAYTIGAGFFLVDHRYRYAHFIWHLFVLVGSACHFLAALRPVAA